MKVENTIAYFEKKLSATRKSLAGALRKSNNPSELEGLRIKQHHYEVALTALKEYGNVDLIDGLLARIRFLEKELNRRDV